jgi:hypothetical protein
VNLFLSTENIFVFKIAINLCESLMNTQESALFPNLPSLEQLLQWSPFVKEEIETLKCGPADQPLVELGESLCLELMNAVN